MIDSMRQGLRWRDLLGRAAVIVLMGMGAYAPVVHGDWLPDDDLFVAGNLAVRSGSWGRLFLLWLDPDGIDYFPLTTTAFWIEHAFFGLETTGYHVTTILLHVANGLLLWMLLARMKIPGAWGAALLFTVHPACVESVAWIAETKNTLSLFLFLVSCIFWIMQDDAAEGRRQKSLYAVSLACFLLAMLAKPSVVAMPVVTLLYAWWKRGRLDARDIAHAVPFLLVSIVLGIVTIHFQHGRAIGDEPLPTGGIDSRIAIAGMAILFYLATIVWPVNLVPTYPAWHVDPPAAWQFLPWLVIAGAAWWMWHNRHSWGRHAIFAFGFFLLMIAPVLGFVDMAFMRIAWVADHFLYVPMIGPLTLVVAAAASWIDRVRGPSRIVGVALGGAAAALLAFGTVEYAGQWVSEDRLWSYTVAHNDDSWFAHSRLGSLAFERDDAEAARHHFRHAVRLRPDLGETKNNLGCLLLKKGAHDEAIAAFEEALAASPGLDKIKGNLAEAYSKAGRFDEARDLATKLLETDMTNRRLLTIRAMALLEAGEKDRAIEELRAVLALDPDYEPAIEGLGKATR
ncbi:MAG: tetratricopeptide repeat protein [Planctomycetia bacterium]